MRSKILLGEHDRVITQQCWKFPVPTAHEVKLLLDAFPDFSAPKLGLGFTATLGHRPIEVTRLRWQNFTIREGQVVDHTHKVNKPVGRTTRMGKNYVEKELRKPVYALSKWLNDQLIGYAKIAPKLEAGLLFPWNTRESVAKHLSLLRGRIKKFPKQFGSAYGCFFDKNSHVSVGPDQPIPYRINVYSLRRFCMTFHYYMTFKEDPIATAKFFGHSEAATTLGHYIQPKEAIGLTQEMIDARITIDEFIHLQGKAQMRLEEFDPLWELRFTPVGQATLRDFSEN
jgi:integrase